MHLLLLTDSYPPEVRSASYLMYEFANELKSRGHKITVVTTIPQYNLAEGHDADSYEVVTDEDNIKVVRVNSSYLHKAGYLMRGIAHLALPFTFYRAAKKFVPNRPDIIIVYSPPLTLGIAGVWLKKLFKTKLVLNIQDIFPQNAIDLGILKNTLIIKFFEAMEKWIYKRVDKITAHSEGNKAFLIKKKALASDKIDIAYNWVNCELIEKADKSLDFRKLYEIESKLVILFAGVLGPAQGLDVIINIAEKLQNKSNTQFVFVGDGTEKQKLEDKVKELNISNVSFKPFVTPDDYSFLLKEVDIGLVSLNKNNKTPVIPGKIFGYMAAGLPVLAVLNKESDGHGIIKQAECGLCFYPDDEDGIVQAVLEMEKNKEDRINKGEKGKAFVKNNFSRQAAVDKYENIFDELLGV